MKTTSRSKKTTRLTGTPAHPPAVIQLGKEFRNLRAALEKAEHEIELQAVQIKELVDDNGKLNLEITTLTEKLEKANKQLAWFRTNKFGSTTEQEGAQPAKPTSGAKES